MNTLSVMVRMAVVCSVAIMWSSTAPAQSKLLCKTCHVPENADWSAGRHSNTQTDLAGELAANWAGQRPDSVINGSEAEDCVSCHGPAAVATGTGLTEVQVMSHFFTTTGGVFTDSTFAADTANWPHVACVSCHNVPTNHPVAMPTVAIFNSSTTSYDSVRTTSELCGQCHGTIRFADTDHRIFDAWKLSKHGHGGQGDLAGELAASWAGEPPDSVINGSEAENCIACHAPSSVPQKGSITEVEVLKRFFTTTSGLFTPLTTISDTVHWPDMACNSCHNPHNPKQLSYYNSSTKAYQVMTSPDSLCGQCHGSLRFPETDHRSFDLEKGTGAVGVPNRVTMPGAGCVDCHMGQSDADGMNSLMFKGHRWTPIVQEPDGSKFASCTKCHSGMTADSALAQIERWKSEFTTQDSIAEALVSLADSLANARHDSTKIRLVANAQQNLAMAETDESGGFHNHLYSMALLKDAAARASFVTGIAVPQTGTQLPAQFALLQNYPNPFNPSTKIRYELPALAKVSLKIFNLLGQEMAELVNEDQAPGRYEVQLNAQNFASGVYLYRLRAGAFVQTRKLILLR